MKNLSEYRELILELEQHIDCLIIFDHYEDSKEEDWSALDNLDTVDKELKKELREDQKEYIFFTEKLGPKVIEVVKQTKQPEKKNDDPFDGLMGGDDDSDGIDLMDMDFSAPPKKSDPKPASV